MTTIMNNAAEKIDNGVEHSKAFFDLGWDYYSALQGLPHEAEKYTSFMDGYNAAKERIKPVRKNRFYLKWLQLRFGALKRNRIFDSLVTPDTIRDIDVDYCPITLMRLTHSTKSDSDWSIDRLSNQHGYVLGNLIMVSRKANSAKSDMSIDDIVACASSSESTNGLTPIEWQRWLAICSLNVFFTNDDGSFDVGYYCVPFVVECPSNVVISPSAFLQMAIANKARGGLKVDFYILATNGLSKPSKKSFNRVLSEAIKHRHYMFNNECDIWFIPKLFKQYHTAFSALPKTDLSILAANVDRISKGSGNGSVQVNLTAHEWNPKLRGYVQ